MLLKSVKFKKVSSNKEGRACITNFNHGSENILRRNNLNC
jgi:hypothetical protein